MRTFLLIVISALLSALSLIYAQLNNLLPEFFALLNLPEGTVSVSDTISTPGAPCTTPRGETIEHGQVFLSFAAETGSLASGGCESRSTVCNNGSWSAEQEPLPAKNCVLETPKNCEINGFIFAHGTSKEFYTFDETNQSCESKTRTCTDGKMDGDELYEYVSCPSSCPSQPKSGSISTGTEVTCPECPCLDKQPEIKPIEASKTEIKKSTIPTTTTTIKPNIQPVTAPLTTTSPNEPNCPAPFGGKRREPGQQGTAYKQAIAPYGTECKQVSIVCSYGSIRYGTKGNAGDVALGVASTCRVGEPVSCDSACGPIKHGNQVVTFGQSIIPFANGQVCDDSKITSTCSNGVLSPAAGSSCSCQIAPPAACTAPNGQTVTHEGSITLYQEPSVQAVAGDGADTCLRQFRRCFNGTFVDAGGNPSPLTYEYPSCTVIPPQG